MIDFNMKNSSLTPLFGCGTSQQLVEDVESPLTFGLEDNSRLLEQIYREGVSISYITIHKYIQDWILAPEM